MKLGKRPRTVSQTEDIRIDGVMVKKKKLSESEPFEEEKQVEADAEVEIKEVKKSKAFFIQFLSLSVNVSDLLVHNSVIDI